MSDQPHSRPQDPHSPGGPYAPGFPHEQTFPRDQAQTPYAAPSAHPAHAPSAHGQVPPPGPSRSGTPGIPAGEAGIAQTRTPAGLPPAGYGVPRHPMPPHDAAVPGHTGTPRSVAAAVAATAVAPPGTAAPAAADPAARPLTPAQRARAEGWSPIIAPGIQPALLTAGLAALLALTAPFGRPALTAGVVLLQALTAAGWYRLCGMWPARQGIALAFAGAVAADVALLTTGRAQAPTAILGTLGVLCVLVLLLQLRNRSTPDERLHALTAGVASTTFAILAAGHLSAAAVSSDAVVVGALAVGAAVVAAASARALPLPSLLPPAIALAAATAAGLGAGRWTELGEGGALLGAAAGVLALVGLRVASYDYPSRFVHMTAGVALPLAMAAPVVHILGQALV